MGGLMGEWVGEWVSGWVGEWVSGWVSRWVGGGCVQCTHLWNLIFRIAEINNVYPSSELRYDKEHKVIWRLKVMGSAIVILQRSQTQTNTIKYTLSYSLTYSLFFVTISICDNMWWTNIRILKVKDNQVISHAYESSRRHRCVETSKFIIKSNNRLILFRV